MIYRRMNVRPADAMVTKVRGEHPNGAPRVLVASYYYVRQAAKEAGTLHGVAVGAAMLSDYINMYGAPQEIKIE